MLARMLDDMTTDEIREFANEVDRRIRAHELLAASVREYIQPEVRNIHGWFAAASEDCSAERVHAR